MACHLWAGIAGVLLCSPAAQAASVPDFSARGAAPRLLAAHNGERLRMRLPGLRWDPALAASAAAYGRTLARLGTLRHSPRSSRPGQHENLWMGSRGAFSPEQMVGSWLSERAYFRPHLASQSRTGNWMDVAHYVAMTSRDAARVGCAIQQSAHWDFLICRYAKEPRRPTALASNLERR